MSFEELIEEVRTHYINKLCISSDGTTIGRVIGVADDGDDYYYIMSSIARETWYESAVLSPIPLDGIDEILYKRLDGFYELNGAGSVDEMVICRSEYEMLNQTIEQEFSKFMSKYEYLRDIDDNKECLEENRVWLDGAKTAFRYLIQQRS